MKEIFRAGVDADVIVTAVLDAEGGEGCAGDSYAIVGGGGTIQSSEELTEEDGVETIVFNDIYTGNNWIFVLPNFIDDTGTGHFQGPAIVEWKGRVDTKVTLVSQGAPDFERSISGVTKKANGKFVTTLLLDAKKTVIQLLQQCNSNRE